MLMLLLTHLLLPIALWSGPDGPTAQALIARRAKEKSPIWVDGAALTLFYRGEAAEVAFYFGGMSQKLRRLPDSDVWTGSITKPDAPKAVFEYAFVTGKTGRPHFQLWRGPQAPPAPAVADKLTGHEKTFDFDSKALGGKRQVRVYLPPGHDKNRTYPVVFATDGQTHSEVLEPLILAGKVPPLIVVGAASGGYLRDVQKNLRTLEYIPGLDADRFARHERFFTEELPAWAEKEFGAGTRSADRAVYGSSNAGRFALEMGLRHPDRFGHVFAFSIAGAKTFQAPPAPPRPPRYRLAAGTWEEIFFTMTERVAKELKGQGVSVEFVRRVAGHDQAMWREEFAAAVQEAFGKKN
jgi:enterochelin esterase-like enzyme